MGQAAPAGRCTPWDRPVHAMGQAGARHGAGRAGQARLLHGRDTLKAPLARTGGRASVQGLFCLFASLCTERPSMYVMLVLATRHMPALLSAAL